MSLYILASLFILCITLGHALKKQSRKQAQSEESFWAKERRSNSVRRKPLDQLEYITIPMEIFPVNVLRENSTISECIETLEILSQQKIVNLTGISNTDLKLEYGTANITALMEYDQNYTLLARTLQKWADTLLEEGYTDEAVILMEFAISTRTDVSRTYYKLAEIYASHLDTRRIHALIEVATKLPTSTKNTIVRTLQESYL
uniref:hypothetical protein n=1 Tax=Acetatifactor sp. TaxID=1872090 RepID=UPI0040574E9A